jgi:hypothetical protein
MRLINLPRPEAAGFIYPLLTALSMMSSPPRDWLPITSTLATCGHVWSDFGKCNSKHLRTLKQSSIHSGRLLSMISSVTTCETYSQKQKRYTPWTFRLYTNSNWGSYMTPPSSSSSTDLRNMPPGLFPSELFWNFASYRQSVGLLGRLINPVATSLLVYANANRKETRTDIHATNGIQTCDPNVRAGEGNS